MSENPYAVPKQEPENPYAAPKANPANPFASASEQSIRMMHIKHEASVKSLGVLYLLGFIVLLIGGLSSFDSTSFEKSIFFPLSALFLVLGIGIRQLKNWARIACSVMAGIRLLGFPVGTIINAYILYLLLSSKGRTVCSPDYQRAIAATPNIKYRASAIVWVFLILLLILLVAIFALALLKG